MLVRSLPNVFSLLNIILHAPRIRHSIVRYLCRLRSTSKFMLAETVPGISVFGWLDNEYRIQTYDMVSFEDFHGFLRGNGLRR